LKREKYKKSKLSKKIYAQLVNFPLFTGPVSEKSQRIWHRAGLGLNPTVLLVQNSKNRKPSAFRWLDFF